MSTAPVTQPEPRERTDEFTSIRHVYEPHRVGLPPLGSYLRELWRRREFAFELSRTDLRSQHYDTLFGQLWLVLNPLLLACVYFVLVDILRARTGGVAFFAHLMAALFAYYFVTDAIRQAVRSVTGGGRLILNTAFPRLLLPGASVITAFKRFLPTIVIFVPVFFVADLPVGPHLLWLFPVFGLFALLAMGMAALVASLQVYFRDLKNFLQYGLRMWLYGSPDPLLRLRGAGPLPVPAAAEPARATADRVERCDRSRVGARPRRPRPRRRLGYRLLRRRRTVLRLTGA